MGESQYPQQPYPQQPYPQQPQGGGNKIRWLWGCLGCGGAILLLVIVIGGVFTLLSDGDSVDDGADETQDGEDDAAEAGIGDTVESGAFAFTVTEVETGMEEVGDFEGMVETPQGQYVIVHVTVENISDEPGAFDSDTQSLFDDEGNQYNTDSIAQIAIEDSFFEEINPGNKVEGRLVFDMPTDAEPDQIELEDFMTFDSPAVVNLS